MGELVEVCVVQQPQQGSPLTSSSPSPSPTTLLHHQFPICGIINTAGSSSSSDEAAAATGCAKGFCIESSTRSSSSEQDADNDDGWLPITECRKGNAWTSAILLLCSGIGFQALFLPAAFAPLGWVWSVPCFSVLFGWQLYTIWLLVHLHERVPGGTRYSRFLHLSIAAFGQKWGKLLGIFPVMYLSGGTCVMLIITGGGMFRLFHDSLCGGGGGDDKTSLTGAEWFLVFSCMAILISQFHPNLHSVAVSGVSFIGSVAVLSYCAVIIVLSVSKGRPQSISYDSSKTSDSEVARLRDVSCALGLMALTFRGHNLVLEIQGTMASGIKEPSQKPMRRGVTIAYLLIAVCLFSTATCGYWAYGNTIVVRHGGSILMAFAELHGEDTPKYAMGIIYLLVVIHCLSSFQIYAMPVFDNLERAYVMRRNSKCPRWVRSVIRFFFGGLTFFIAVTLPFLGNLAPFIGGITLPLTYSYPCFMWIALRKPRPYTPIWCLNWGLGLLGLLLSAVSVAAALWNLVSNGLDANFFKP